MKRLAIGCFVLVMAASCPGKLRASLVGYWSFDYDTGTTLTDRSGSGNDGTLEGTPLPTWAAGHTGQTGDQSLSFSGGNSTGSSVSLGNPDELKITGNQTISLWVYPTSFTTRQNPYAKAYGGEGTLTQEQNGQVTYYYGTTGTNSGSYPTNYDQLRPATTLALNAWNHLAIVRDFDSGQMRFFINGTKTTAPTLFPAAAVSSLPAYIGRGYVSNDANGSNYNGRIDDVAVFSEALADVQVKALSAGALTPVDFKIDRSDWLKGWLYRQPVIISKDATATDLNGFPVPVKLTGAGNAVFANAKANGHDVVFTAADGVTQLNHEMEAFSKAPGSEQLAAWVNTPLSSSQDTLIYMYYGGPDAGDPSSKATWDTNFKLVQHFEETSGPYTDSTVSNHTMTAPNGAASTTGVFDGAVSVNGIAGQQYLMASGGVEIPVTSSFTLEGWANFSDDNVSNQNQYLFSLGGRAAIRGVPTTGTPNFGMIWQGTSNGGWDSGQNLTGAWHYVAQVFDASQGTNGKMYLYLDGQLISPANGVSVVGTLSGAGAYYAGAWVSTYGYLPGSFDEMRVSNIARSPEWIAAAYRMMTDPNYVAFGAQQYVPEPSSWVLLASAAVGLVLFGRRRSCRSQT